jgi:hypothetical protein
MENADQKPLLELNSRRVRLEDGRYMIFFTFGDQSGDKPSANEAADTAADNRSNV